MKAKNKLWFTLVILLGVAIMLTSNCKKSDNNTNIQTAKNTAAGTYTWNSATGTVTMTWTSSTFKCGGGPGLGTETVTEVVVNTTTMVWNGNVNFNWTRSSGTAGDITGTWTGTESTSGNTYSVTFQTDGTLVLLGTDIKSTCNVAHAEHWPNGYYVSLSYEDPNKEASSVVVTGPGITGSDHLLYDANSGKWTSWDSPYTLVYFGMSYPAPPLTYTFSITDGTGTWTATSIVTCFQEQMVTNIFPNGTFTGTPTFRWSKINDPNARYQVQLNDINNNRIWSSAEISDTSVVYTGTALTAGASYIYDVVLTNSTACDQMSFAVDTLVYQ